MNFEYEDTFYVGLGRGVGTTADAVDGAVCEMMRMPGTRAGLNERSQSAYAMPRPTPVDNETGHARPAINQSLVSHARRYQGGRTFEEYDREDYAYAEAQTAVQERVSKLLAQRSDCAHALTI